MLVCLMAVVLYPIFTLINSIKKGNMLFFVHFFKEKYYLCILLNHIQRYNPKTTKK